MNLSQNDWLNFTTISILGFSWIFSTTICWIFQQLSVFKNVSFKRENHFLTGKTLKNFIEEFSIENGRQFWENIFLFQHKLIFFNFLNNFFFSTISWYISHDKIYLKWPACFNWLLAHRPEFSKRILQFMYGSIYSKIKLIWQNQHGSSWSLEMLKTNFIFPKGIPYHIYSRVCQSVYSARTLILTLETEFQTQFTFHWP